MAGAKREPSSLVQTATSMGAAVSMPLSFRVRITSRPASTPKTPSNLPPVGWVSRWLPVVTGSSLGSVPGRRAKMLPILSTVMLQPASWHHFTKRSRPSRSKSVSARRQLPPATPGPIFAISMRLSHSRSPFTFRFLGFKESMTIATPPPFY